jgi:hypothetical protein
VVSSAPRPHFTPGNDPVPSVQEAGWTPVPVWTGAENLAYTGIPSPDRTVQPVVMIRKNLYAILKVKGKGKGKVHHRTGNESSEGSRDTALLFYDLGTRRGVSGQHHAPAALYPRERPGIHCAGGWVGPRASLDGRKI